jgi:CheY-like chemotaxis protein
MAARLALVVDDSRTARMTLQRMLEKQGLEVDTLESAQEALHYLVNKVPDVIFMDHMMPGMDGFQAVEAIKNNPVTATIPIMMFTSKGGDLYLSQARALGAVGILPKEVQPAELYHVLHNLGLVKDRRVKSAGNRSSFVLLDNPTEIAVSAAREDIQEIARQAADSVSHGSETHSRVEGLIEDHYGAIRKELRDLRHYVETLGAGTFDVDGDNAARPMLSRSTGWLIALVLVSLMLVPAIWLYRHYDNSQHDLANAKIEIEELRKLQQQEKLAGEERASLRAAQDEKSSHTSLKPDLLFNSLAWAVNQGSAYDFREEPFSDRRLAVIYELISRLQALGFKGVVELHSYLGEFCLAGNEANGYTLAPPDTPLRDCALFGHPQQQLPSAGEQQSIAFANFLATSPLVNDSDIRIEIISHQFSEPKLEYPAKDSDITAGAWNRIAAVNNRIEVVLVPEKNQPG